MSPLMPVGELHDLALSLCGTYCGRLLSGQSPTVRVDVEHPAYGIEEETGIVVDDTGVARLPGKGTVFSPFPPTCACCADDEAAGTPP